MESEGVPGCDIAASTTVSAEPVPKRQRIYCMERRMPFQILQAMKADVEAEHASAVRGIASPCEAAHTRMALQECAMQEELFPTSGGGCHPLRLSRKSAMRVHPSRHGLAPPCLKTFFGHWIGRGFVTHLLS